MVTQAEWAGEQQVRSGAAARREDCVVREQARIAELEDRVARLEAELDAWRRGAERRVTHPTGPWPAPHAVPPPAAGSAFPPPSVAPPAPAVRSFELDSETALKWGGVGLVVLAVGFAVSTAISRGWVGPELQLAGAVALGLGLVAVGVRMRSARPGWMHAPCTGGVLALMTTAASDLLVDEHGTIAASVGMVLVGVGGLALAWRLRSEWVSAATVLSGLAAPFAIGGDDTRVVPTTIWVVALTGASLALSVRRSWFGARVAAHAAALLALLALAPGADPPAARIVLLAGCASIVASMAWVPSIGDLTSVGQRLEIQLASALAPWVIPVIGITYDLDGHRSWGWTSAAAGVGGALVALAVWGRVRRAHAVSLTVGASVALSIGLALLLSTAAALVALAVQGAGLVVLARQLRYDVRVLVDAGVLLVIAVAATTARLVDAWSVDAPFGDDLAHAAVVVAAAVASWVVRRRPILVAGGLVVLGLVLLWLGSALVHLPQGQAAVSVAWAVVGTALLVLGAVRKVPELGAAGLGVLGLTVGKLLTVDLREVDTLWRAGLFLVVGLGFLRLGFLLPRLTGGLTGGRRRSTGDRKPDAPAAPS